MQLVKNPVEILDLFDTRHLFWLKLISIRLIDLTNEPLKLEVVLLWLFIRKLVHSFFLLLILLLLFLVCIFDKFAHVFESLRLFQ